MFLVARAYSRACMQRMHTYLDASCIYLCVMYTRICVHASCSSAYIHTQTYMRRICTHSYERIECCCMVQCVAVCVPFQHVFHLSRRRVEVCKCESVAVCCSVLQRVQSALVCAGTCMSHRHLWGTYVPLRMSTCRAKGRKCNGGRDRHVTQASHLCHIDICGAHMCHFA